MRTATRVFSDRWTRSRTGRYSKKWSSAAIRHGCRTRPPCASAARSRGLEAMRSLAIRRRGERLSVLCLGAHSDDIEIGVGGTILQWLKDGAELDVWWCVLSAGGPRKSEAMASAADFLSGVERNSVELQEFRDGYFPASCALASDADTTHPLAGQGQLRVSSSCVERGHVCRRCQ